MTTCSRARVKLLFVSFIMLAVVVHRATAAGHPPVNPKATPEARALLEFLYAIDGKYVLSGQHHGPRNPIDFLNDVQEITGHYPVVWGNDFGYAFNDRDPHDVRQEMIDTAKRLHRDGAIITLMWHCCYPPDGITCARETIWVMDKVKPPAEWRELTTPGTRLYEQWAAQVDLVAGYLQQLQDAGIPVLWRPYHEMNGVWFWWCQHPGPDGFARLWNQLYDRLTRHHGLNNLIWVWNANAPRDLPGDEARPYADYFPGHATVDVLAADVYNNDYRQSHHDQLRELAQGRLIALGEVGELPAPATLAAQPNWTWFMCWARWVHTHNQPDGVRALYADPRVLTLDEVLRDELGRFYVRVPL